MGRHTTYTQDMADRIIAWLAEGKTLREFCRQDGTPSHAAVYAWREANPDFAVRFARAREDGADVIAQEALTIADTPMSGVRVEINEAGATKTVREDMLGHRKLQVETRLKLLAKWFPKQYGDSLTHRGDATAPVALNLSGSDIHG